MQKDGTEKYGPVAQLLHWLTAVLVLIAFVYGPGGPELRVYAATRDFDRHLHETLGLAVLALSVLRLLWRLASARPQELPMARWMALAAKAVQAFLYLLLFAVPLSAILGAWLSGHSVDLLTGQSFASPLSAARETGLWLAHLHGWLGDAILWLAGLHAAAAIFHHAVIKDGVLASMLPRWAERRP